MRDFMGRSLKENPEPKKYQLYNFIYATTAILYWIIALIFVFTFFQSFPEYGEFLAKNKVAFWWLFIATQSTFSYVSNKKTAFYWQWIEQRRFAAVRGAHAWDAVEQPTANPAALGLPTTITLRTNKKPSFKALARIYVGVLAYLIILSALCAWSSDFFLLLLISRNRFYDFLIVLAFFGLLGLLLFGLSRFYGSGIKIVVTEQGMQIGKNLVKWEEARLFAMYKGLNVVGTTYELSSATNIVRWTVFPNPQLPQNDESYAASVNEYSRQVRALNEVIVARTGLPLSDLR